jgi:hypothetical protein
MGNYDLRMIVSNFFIIGGGLGLLIGVFLMLYGSLVRINRITESEPGQYPIADARPQMDVTEKHQPYGPSFSMGTDELPGMETMDTKQTCAHAKTCD